MNSITQFAPNPPRLMGDRRNSPPTMEHDTMTKPTRRGFLGGSLAALSLPILGQPSTEAPAPPAQTVGQHQPLPTACTVSHIRTESGWVSAIARTWSPGDGERCRLCPDDNCCLSERGTCLRQFAEYVEPADAVLFADPALELEGGAR